MLLLWDVNQVVLGGLGVCREKEVGWQIRYFSLSLSPRPHPTR